MVMPDTDTAALDGMNAAIDQIARATRVYLQPLHNAQSLQQKIFDKAYILHLLFGPAYPLVIPMSTEVMEHIDASVPHLTVR